MVSLGPVPRQNSDLPSNQLIKLRIQIGLSPCQTDVTLSLAKIAISFQIMQISCAPDWACLRAKLRVCYPC
jgi:hypothetical protein